MYHITMNGRPMPLDHNLDIWEACARCDIYKRHNTKAVFAVVNDENGDIEYEV